MIYKDYLKSKKWKRIKEKKIKQWFCILCGTNKNLNIHHLNYKHITNETGGDLICLCWDCHRLWHILKPSNKMANKIRTGDYEAIKLLKEKLKSLKVALKR